MLQLQLLWRLELIHQIQFAHLCWRDYLVGTKRQQACLRFGKRLYTRLLFSRQEFEAIEQHLDHHHRLVLWFNSCKRSFFCNRSMWLVPRIISNGLKCVATGSVATFHDQQTKLWLFQDFSREQSLYTNFSQFYPLNSAATTISTFRSHGDPPAPFSAVKMRMLSL